MKKITIGLWLLTLCACSAVAKMSEQVNEEINSYLAEREKTQYVQVVYPTELRQYGEERDNAAYPKYLLNNGMEKR